MSSYYKSHQHAHAHQTAGLDGATVAEKNEKYWSAVADIAFKIDWVQALYAATAAHLTTSLPWLGIPTTPYTSTDSPRKMLDYACGSGLPSRTLSPYFHTFVGFDLSANMLEKYTSTALSDGIPDAGTRFKTMQGDLMVSDAEVAPALQGEELFNFDLVVISMALHHIEDPALALQRLAKRVKVGGVLLVIDWTRPEGEEAGSSSEYPAAHTIMHHSFQKNQMNKWFEAAGCEEFGWTELPERSVLPAAKDGTLQLAFARGTKRA